MTRYSGLMMTRRSPDAADGALDLEALADAEPRDGGAAGPAQFEGVGAVVEGGDEDALGTLLGRVGHAQEGAEHERMAAVSHVANGRDAAGGARRVLVEGGVQGTRVLVEAERGADRSESTRTCQAS